MKIDWTFWKKKLSSRKFWMALITTVSGIMGMFGAGDSTIKNVVSLGVILIPAIIYIVTESRIDKAALEKIDMASLEEWLKNFYAAQENGKTEAAVGKASEPEKAMPNTAATVKASDKDAAEAESQVFKNAG